MSWAARRRILYVLGVVVFFAVVIGGPILYHILTIPSTCHDGIQNQGETSPDRGGPCLLLDSSSVPASVLWSRALKVRDGLYDAIVYINNPSSGAGITEMTYDLKLLDSNNILVADVIGSGFVMPNGITPIFVGGIDTGHREAIRAQFQIENATFERVLNPAAGITITNQQATEGASSSEVTALAANTSVAAITNLTFVATVFDPDGNAIETSQTALPRLDAGQQQQIFFTWPESFPAPVGRVDIIAVVAPEPDPSALR